MLVLFIGPTGSGKSALIHELCKFTALEYIRPDITRPLRDGETDKNHVALNVFRHREAAGEYVVVNQFFGSWYGTPYAAINDAIASPTPSHLLDFALEGLTKLLSLGGYCAIIFVMPPSVNELRSRLVSAGRNSRVDDALEQYPRYVGAIERLTSTQPHPASFHVVTNSHLDTAVKSTYAIIRSLGYSKPSVD